VTSPRVSFRSPQEDGLKWAIEQPAPSELAVGGGSAVPLLGWCFHREAPLRELRFVINRLSFGALAHSLPRPDVYRALYPVEDPLGHSYASGFYAVLPLPGVAARTRHQIFLQAELANGRREQRAIDNIVLLPSSPPRSAGARIAICMATYDPPLELFARQIESIRAQSRDDWECLISDDRSPPQSFDRMVALLGQDDRFIVERSPVRLGFYRNFERALGLVGSQTEFVALADQDDWWRPEKLDVLVGALGGGAQLAYSDCRVITSDGHPVSSSFFQHRRNNSSDLGRMLVANSVTGAASLFRRGLLDDLLPFPPPVGTAYHDHWLAVVALASGRLAYVDRPLYDYVQHGENALGFLNGQRPEDLDRRGAWMLHSRAAYRHDLLRIFTQGWTLEYRFGARLDPEKRLALGRLMAIESSPKARARLALQALTAGPQRSATLGAERDLLSALVWRRVMSRAGRHRPRLADARFSSAFDETPARTPRAGLRSIGSLVEQIRPLALERSPAEPERVNVLLARADREPLRGGHSAAFNLGARLGQRGVRVRIVACDGAREAERPPDRVQRPRAHSGLEAADGRLELIDAADRATVVPVSPRDSFIATTWSTAHIAWEAAQALGRERFLYLIQEYEPLAFAAGGLSMAAEESYRFPHVALFSTEPLRDYFRALRIGVFATEGSAGNGASLSFDDAIAAVDPPTLEELRMRTSRRLLFHCRPEPDATRTMFELGMIGLARAAQAGWLAGWEVNGIGSERPQPPIELAPGVDLVALECAEPQAYVGLLRAHDVGLALLATPHPSLVSLEMASAAMCTVTNSHGVKDRDWLQARSPNLVVAEPTAAAITEAIRVALGRAEEYPTRVAGAGLAWPRSWTDALDDGLIDRVVDLLRRC